MCVCVRVYLCLYDSMRHACGCLCLSLCLSVCLSDCLSVIVLSGVCASVSLLPVFNTTYQRFPYSGFGRRGRRYRTHWRPGCQGK